MFNIPIYSVENILFETLNRENNEIYRFSRGFILNRWRKRRKKAKEFFGNSNGFFLGLFRYLWFQNNALWKNNEKTWRWGRMKNVHKNAPNSIAQKSKKIVFRSKLNKELWTAQGIIVFMSKEIFNSYM